MAGYTQQLDPVDVPKVETRYRRIATQIPTPQSLPLFETLQQCEPRAVGTQVPVVWDRAEGFQVFDPYGNCWIDLTSGILVANAGHSHPHVRETLRRHIEEKPLHSYLFATKARAGLVKKLLEVSPPNLNKVFLLSTGSEAVECALKLSRLYGVQQKPHKNAVISFAGSFHGKTLGAQMLCSAKDHKEWITSPDPDIHQIPFPRCCECPWGRDHYDYCGKECFENGLAQLRDRGVDLRGIVAFVLEGYQGIRGPIFFPNDFAQAVRDWTKARQALIVVDEIQSGFGRTGKLFAYQHYGIEADLVCCGKAISSCLPLSAVLGRAEIMDIPQPGDMTSTHMGNPLCCAAALSSLEVIEQEDLIAAAARKGRLMEKQLAEIRSRHPSRVGMMTGRGLVYALFFVRPGSQQPDIEFGDWVVVKAIQKGVMLFITSNGSVKICPPLVITDDALREGIAVISEAIDECLDEEKR